MSSSFRIVCFGFGFIGQSAVIEERSFCIGSSLLFFGIGAVVGDDGHVDDGDRIDYLERYLGAVARAMDEGVPVHGHFVWSLLDNFEWSEGYSKRFGLVYVDYETLERVPKSSFYWYRDLIGAGRLPEPEPF